MKRSAALVNEHCSRVGHEPLHRNLAGLERRPPCPLLDELCLKVVKEGAQMNSLC